MYSSAIREFLLGKWHKSEGWILSVPPSKPFMSATFSLPMMEVYQKQSPSELSAEHSSSRKPSLTCTPPPQSRLSLSHSPLDSR